MPPLSAQCKHAMTPAPAGPFAHAGLTVPPPHASHGARAGSARPRNGRGDAVSGRRCCAWGPARGAIPAWQPRTGSEFDRQQTATPYLRRPAPPGSLVHMIRRHASSRQRKARISPRRLLSPCANAAFHPLGRHRRAHGAPVPDWPRGRRRGPETAKCASQKNFAPWSHTRPAPLQHRCFGRHTGCECPQYGCSCAGMGSRARRPCVRRKEDEGRSERVAHGALTAGRSRQEQPCPGRGLAHSLHGRGHHNGASEQK